MVSSGSATPFRVSIVIPALDQFKCLDATLDALAALNAFETVVVDGGSSDGSADRARERGVRVLTSTSPRGRRLNLGADLVHGDIVLFIDAGVTPNQATMDSIQSAFDDRRVVGGYFRSHTGLFVWRGAFEMIDGFRPYAIFEDLDLIKRLRNCGRVVRVASAIPSASHRRRHFILRPLYHLGISPQSLARFASPDREIIGPRYPAMRLADGYRGS